MADLLEQRRNFPRVDWDMRRTERNLARVRQRLHQREQRRKTAALVTSAAALIVLMLGAGWHWLGKDLGAQNELAELRGERTVRFEDGSSVQLLDETSELAVESVSSKHVEVALESGRGFFDVTPDPGRAFVVHAGPVTVRVLGTAFRVARANERVLVEVTRGRVQVTWEGGQRLLEAGHSAWLPPKANSGGAQPQIQGSAQPAEAPSVSASPEPTPAERPKAASKATHQVQFRRLAQQGDYSGAYAVLKERPDVVGPSAADLMLAADAARLSGHPAAAVPYLQRVIQNHKSDSRAPLAAFTLGRILLNQLGRPAEAARAFQTTQRLAPGGALAEDALARQIEAHARAGAKARAQALAKEYLKRYPAGRRRDAVRQHGGLE